MPEPTDMRLASYVIFALGQVHAALPLNEVREVLPLPALLTPPHLPALLSGFVNLAGTLLPVLELAHVLGLPESPARIDQHLLALHNQPLLCRVDQVLEICSLPAALPLPPEQTLNHCAQGLLSYREQPVYLLASSQLLLREEQLRLQALAQQAQARLDNLTQAEPLT